MLKHIYLMMGNKLNVLLKEKANELGISLIGFAKVRTLIEDQNSLSDYINKCFHAEMSYMERNMEKRINPNLLEPYFTSAIVIGVNYHPENRQENNTCKIADYALGKDYHLVLKEMMHELAATIKNIDNSIQYRCFVDSAPVLEKRWAQLAGLGWIGKNTLLINRYAGSKFFIGILFINLEMDYDKAFENNFCGDCNRCIRACPTGAIESPFILNANKCISYQTIEKKGDADDEIKPQLNQYIFGCDICQDVCPWNKKVLPNTSKAFSLAPEWINYNSQQWSNLTEEDFNRMFINSSVYRTGYQKIKSNINNVNRYLNEDI